MKALLIAMNVVAGLVLIRFTVSKFAAWPESVAGFVDMAKPLGIDPTFFRIATGFIIGYAALSFFTNVLIIGLKKERNPRFSLLLAFNIVYATGAMAGALFSEFFLRSSVKWLLVYIAIGVVAVSMANLGAFYGNIFQTLRGLGKNVGDAR